MTNIPLRGPGTAAALVASAFAVSGMPATAVAQTATSVRLERGASVRDCLTLPVYGRQCGAFGMTGVTVSWAATCAEGTASSVSVELRRRAGATPAQDDAVAEQVPDPVASGSQRFTVEPGQRLYGLIRATCSTTTGDQTTDEAETTASSAVLSVAPALVGYLIMENRICGFPRVPLQTTLQARNWAEVVYFPRFAGDGVFTTLLAKGDLSRIRLSAHGAGVSTTAARPNSRIFKRYGEAGLRVTPRRGGKLRIHATIDGMQTPSRTVRVLPPRRACAGSPRR